MDMYLGGFFVGKKRESGVGTVYFQTVSSCPRGGYTVVLSAQRHFPIPDSCESGIESAPLDVESAPLDNVVPTVAPDYIRGAAEGSPKARHGVRSLGDLSAPPG
jgi:hypothetical protein